MRRPVSLRVLCSVLPAAMILGAVLGPVLVANRSALAAQSWLVGGVQLIDRKFPASWCPYEFVRFTALDSQATLVFEASNLSNPTDPYDHLLDNLMVVERSTWDAFASVSQWLGGSCNCFGADPQSTFDFDAFLASSNPDPAKLPYLELFDTDPTTGPGSAWTLSSGASFQASVGGSAPNPPYDFNSIDPTSGTLALNLGPAVAGSITAQVAIDGLVPDTEYVVAGWWSVIFGGSCSDSDAPLSVDVVGEDVTAAPGTGISSSAGVRIESAQPNPTTERTRVQLRLPAGDRGELRVYDVAGRLVRRYDVQDDGRGSSSVIWDSRDQQGRAVASGTYLLRLITTVGEHSHRIALVR